MGAFLTEMKSPPTVTQQTSRQNLTATQGEMTNSAARVAMGRTSANEAGSAGRGFSPVTSPASKSMMVSFNFLTQVPIEEFVIQEHSKASKLSARFRSTASRTIENELQRKIKEKFQQARLDRVLKAQELKQKTDVDTLKQREKEKREAVDEALKAIRHQERTK